MSKFVQAIQVGGNVTGIMRLPCVTACLKLNNKNGLEWLEYVINGDDNQRVEQGDWICQDQDGRWHGMSDEEYRKEVNNERDH